MRYFITSFVLLGIVLVGLLGFRGDKFKKPPLYIFPDMDWQAKYLPQTPNPFYKDGMADRLQVAGTVQRGNAANIPEVFDAQYTYEPALNPSKYSGKNNDGSWVRGYPVEVNEDLMALGQEKYNIFCIVCHGGLGDGNGITKQYGMIATPSYHDERLRTMAEGEIFNTITNGKGLMNSYADKLSPKERWAVILYVRALQRAAEVPFDSLSADQKTALEVFEKQKEAEKAAAEAAKKTEEQGDKSASTPAETPSEEPETPIASKAPETSKEPEISSEDSTQEPQESQEPKQADAPEILESSDESASN